MTVQDLRKLINYWISGSDYDWKTAQALFKAGKYPYALFMAHLSVEKLLKGLIVKETRDHAPFTHNLVYLAGKIALDFSKEQIALLEEMNDFNLEARYPDEQREFYKKATKVFARRYLATTARLREWLKEKF
jgi:HEPN domain-containing protein